MRARSFTLVEVMAVVAMLGLLAGATVWSLAGDVRHHSREAIIGRIAHADAMARLAALRRGETCRLVFDLDTQRLWRAGDAETDGRRDHAAVQLHLPPDCRIDRIVFFTSAPAPGNDAPTAAAAGAWLGVVEIPYSSAGRGPSYAVRLTWHDDDDDGSTWMVFAGMTGQVTLIHDQDQIDNLLALVALGRHDAR